MTTGAATFETHRDLLLSVAYRMLGSVTEAEDTVQEAWLRWSRVDHEQVSEPRAYLVKLTTRAAYDQLRRARAQRETYVGSWLPEPLVTGPDIAEDAALADSVSMAMLIVMESLSPLERSVFVLREAFGYSHAEIAEILGRSAQSVRQVAHRARRNVEARRPRFESDRKVRREATERFLRAALGGDLAELMEVLAPDVTMWSDSGGKIRSPRRPIRGVAKILRFFAGAPDRVPPDATIRMIEANGGPAGLVVTAGAPAALVTIEVDPGDHRIAAIRVVGNPDKLRSVNA